MADKIEIKLSFKLLAALCMNPEGLTYKQLSAKTGFHVNTVSRSVSYMYSKGLVEMKQDRSNSVRGKKWVNVVKLKKEFVDVKNATDFFTRVIKQLDGGLSDIFSS